jgi:hypothetical protein
MKRHQSDQEISDRIVDYLYGELPTEEAEQVRHRVESDPAWQAEYRILETTFQALDAWGDRDVPADATAAVRDRINRHHERPAATRAWLRVLWERLAPVAAAVLVSVTILWTTTSSLGVGAASVKDLLFCGVLWGGIYHLVFMVLLRRDPSYIWVPAANRGFVCLELRRAVLWGAVAFVLFFAAALATPNPAPFETRPTYMAIANKIPYFVAFLEPAVYALVGCLIAAFVLGRRAGGDAGAQGTLMGVIAGILIVLDLYTYHLVEPNSTLLHLAVWSFTAFFVAVASGHWGALLGSRKPPPSTG